MKKFTRKWDDIIKALEVSNQIRYPPSPVFLYRTPTEPTHPSLEHLHQAQREGVLSQQLLMGNVSRFVAGVLLIIPGLISDVLAVAVLIAPLRMLLAKLLVGGSINAQHNPYQGQGQGQGESFGFQTGPGHRRFEDDGVTLEGEFQSVSPEQEGEDREASGPLEHQPPEPD